MKVEKVSAWWTDDGRFHASEEDARKHAQVEEMRQPLEAALTRAGFQEWNSTMVRALAREILAHWAVVPRGGKG